MILFVVVALLALAALSLGLRTTSVLIPRANPLARLLAAIATGMLFVFAILQLGDRFRVYDLGLGLLLSLAPVGLFDVTKWWFLRRR